MKKLLPAFFLFAIFTSGNLFSQQSWNIPLSLYAATKDLPAQQMIGILVEGSPVAIAEAAKKHNGFLAFNSGTVCSVRIPAGQLVPFSQEPGIIRIGGATHNQPLNDTMKVQVRANQVHAGMAPLTQAYEGDDVILGIIDTGIDFTHPDFLDANGDTRVLWIWDQRDASGPGPTPWNYGTLWDSAQINAGTCLHNDLTYYGHGTGVSGIAAGDGSSTTARDYAGVAPKANLIVVALDFNGANSPVAVADAAAFIYNQALALGRPCVINASVGDYLGSHDGQDLQALMIDSLLDIPARSFVCASGNAGNLPIHLTYPLTSDTNLTWFNTNGPSMYIQLWADTNNFNAAQMAVGCVQDGSWIEKGNTMFTNVTSNLSVTTTDTLWNAANQQMALIYRYASIQGSAYSMEIFIDPDSASGYDYSLLMTGAGEFHLWSFDMYGNALPSAGAYPAIIYYKEPDTLYTVCSSFQCSDRTITVANYVNRDTWMNVNGTWVADATVTEGDIMYNSSVGPTRDGRQKPDISAPGANDLTCGVISTLPAIIAGAPDVVGTGGYHVVAGGTSAASPVVAGCAALWMQQFPNAGWADVKAAVTYCSIQDTFTGVNLPDYTWGAGKVDAFGMMTNCALTTGDHAQNGINQLSIYPNPVNGSQFVTFEFPASTETTTLRIYNSLGAVVFTQEIAGGTMKVNIDIASFASGCYSVVLSGKDQIFTGKMLVN
jgi:hypothetical protein